MAKTLPKETLVVDFGYQVIRLVHIEIINSKPKIKNIASCPLDPVMTDEQTKTALERSLSTLQLKGHPRVAVPWDDELIYKQLTLPEMPKEDFQRAFDWELKNKHFIGPEDHLIGSEYILENETGDGGREKLYGVFYCEKNRAMEKLRCLQSAGLEVNDVVPIHNAISSLVGSDERAQDSDCLVFHIGYENARVLIVRNKKVIFSRSVLLGGHHLTEMMTMPFSVDNQRIQYDSAQAEKIKVEQGAQNPQSPQVTLIRPYLEKIVSEIKRSIDFYETQKYSRPVKKVFFTGGGSNLKGLFNFMTRFLDLETVVLGAEGYISADSAADQKQRILGDFGSLEPALGAAMLPQGSINLLPSEVQHKKKQATIALAARLAVFGCGILLIFMSIWFVAGKHIIDSQLRSLEGESKEIGRMNDLLKNIRVYENFRRVAIKGSLSHAILLKEISRAIPDPISLDALEFNREEKIVTMHGFVSANSGGDLKALTDFVNRLSQTSLFENATLVNTSQTDGSQNSNFEIKCTVRELT